MEIPLPGLAELTPYFRPSLPLSTHTHTHTYISFSSSQGTQEIVERLYVNNLCGLSAHQGQSGKRLYFASIHAESIFPWTSVTRKLPSGVPSDVVTNFALPIGSNSTLWREKVTEVMTQMQAFEPDLVLVSAGFDAHKSDNFGGGHMDLEAADYFWVADELAHRFPRIVSVLEGGYNIEVLSMCCTSHIQGLGL